MTMAAPVKPRKACTGCGGSYPRSELTLNRCPRCLAKDPVRQAKAASGSWSPDRDKNAHARWARRIKARAGGQCEAIVTQAGRSARCPVTSGCQAHHIRHGSYEMEDGAYLCKPHHKEFHAHGVG